MRKYSWKCVLAATALVFLAPASVAVAGSQVPVKGDLALIPDGSGTLKIAGIVSPLGVVTGFAIPQADGNSFTVVAATGDSVSGSGVITALTPGPPGFLAFTEAITITGGSGRYAGATGSALGQGLISLDTGVILESLHGSISSPGS
jgi:hypothetical protein